MPKQNNPLVQLKEQIHALDFTVRQWAAEAGLPWQSVYRRISDPGSTRFEEYDRLLKAAERLKAKKTKKCRRA